MPYRSCVPSVARAIQALEHRLDVVLAMHVRHPANRRLVKHLTHERQALFTYLRREGVEATNWRAEQAIRPAVTSGTQTYICASF
jgi:transposase